MGKTIRRKDKRMKRNLKNKNRNRNKKREVAYAEEPKTSDRD